MDKVFISIITASYNSGKTIRMTLQSVLSQTYDSYEYIIIDGKSTDCTLDIIKEYQEKFDGKLKVVSEEDNGIYDAWNKGIQKATGKWIMFCLRDECHKIILRIFILQAVPVIHLQMKKAKRMKVRDAKLWGLRLC